MKIGNPFKKAKKIVGGNTIGGAAIGLATGGLAGAAIGAGAGLYSDYENYQAQKAADKATEKSNAYEKYLWDLTNAYNDPKAQMERLKAAGLNPNLVYGSGNVTGNTAGTADSTAYSAAGRSDAIGRGLQVASAMANLKQTENQGELLKYQMGQTQAQTEYARLRAQDLHNFLTGTGPTTYSNPLSRYQAPSANPTTTPEEDDYNTFSALFDTARIFLGGMPSNMRERWKRSDLKKVLDKVTKKVDDIDWSNFDSESKRYKSMSSAEKRSYLNKYFL